MGTSTCVGCGECVQACPTGALMPATSMDIKQIGDSSDYDSETKSVCPFCGVGCQISLKVKDGRIKNVDGAPGGKMGHLRIRIYDATYQRTHDSEDNTCNMGRQHILVSKN